jgi:hypothetical protein
MKAISETLSVMLLTVAFLAMTALIYTTIAYQMQNQQAGMFSLLQFKEKQLNEKLSVNVISNTVILYNYGDVAITIKSIYDDQGNPINNACLGNLQPKRDCSFTVNPSVNRIVIVTNYNIFKYNIR